MKRLLRKPRVARRRPGQWYCSTLTTYPLGAEMVVSDFPTWGEALGFALSVTGAEQ